MAGPGRERRPRRHFGPSSPPSPPSSPPSSSPSPRSLSSSLPTMCRSMNRPSGMRALAPAPPRRTRRRARPARCARRASHAGIRGSPSGAPGCMRTARERPPPPDHERSRGAHARARAGSSSDGGARARTSPGADVPRVAGPARSAAATLGWPRRGRLQNDGEGGGGRGGASDFWAPYQGDGAAGVLRFDPSSCTSSIAPAHAEPVLGGRPTETRPRPFSVLMVPAAPAWRRCELCLQISLHRVRLTPQRRSASRSSDVAAARNPREPRRAIVWPQSRALHGKHEGCHQGCHWLHGYSRVAQFVAFAVVTAALPATNTRRMSSSDRLHDSLRLFELKISILARARAGLLLSSRAGSLGARGPFARRKDKQSNEPQKGARSQSNTRLARVRPGATVTHVSRGSARRTRKGVACIVVVGSEHFEPRLAAELARAGGPSRVRTHRTRIRRGLFRKAASSSQGGRC